MGMNVNHVTSGMRDCTARR